MKNKYSLNKDSSHIFLYLIIIIFTSSCSSYHAGYSKGYNAGFWSGFFLLLLIYLVFKYIIYINSTPASTSNYNSNHNSKMIKVINEPILLEKDESVDEMIKQKNKIIDDLENEVNKLVSGTKRTHDILTYFNIELLCLSDFTRKEEELKILENKKEKNKKLLESLNLSISAANDEIANANNKLNTESDRYKKIIDELVFLESTVLKKQNDFLVMSDKERFIMIGGGNE